MQTNENMNLKTQLFSAFASRPRPSADTILQPTISEIEGDMLRQYLAARTNEELTAPDLRTLVEGNLWMLTTEAFLYYLPAFLYSALASYENISVFASGLIDVLTEPTRSGVEGSIEQLEQHQSDLSLPEDMTSLLRKQQLEWFDSGAPTAVFHARFDNLTTNEGAAVLAFLNAFQEKYGEDFPFGELETAIKKHWVRYQR